MTEEIMAGDEADIHVLTASARWLSAGGRFFVRGWCEHLSTWRGKAGHLAGAASSLMALASMRFRKIAVKIPQAISARCLSRPYRTQPSRLAGASNTLSQTCHFPPRSGRHSNLASIIGISVIALCTETP